MILSVIYFFLRKADESKPEDATPDTYHRRRKRSILTEQHYNVSDVLTDCKIINDYHKIVKIRVKEEERLLYALQNEVSVSD